MAKRDALSLSGLELYGDMRSKVNVIQSELDDAKEELKDLKVSSSSLSERITRAEEKIKGIVKQLENTISKDEFTPVKALSMGAAGILLTWVISAILNGVAK